MATIDKIKEVRDSLELMLLNTEAGLFDLQESFHVDWEFVFLYKDGQFTNLESISIGTTNTPLNETWLSKKLAGTTIKQEDNPVTLSYKDAWVNGLILRLVYAFFEDGAGSTLSEEIATAILLNINDLTNQKVWGWKGQVNSEPRSVLKLRGGLNGLRDRNGETTGLTGLKFLDKIDALVTEKKIEEGNLISFIAWTMKDKPDMWRNLPLWNYFIRRSGDYSYNQMDVDIMTEIRTHLDNSINNPTAQKPEGYSFTSWPALNTWGENPISRTPEVVDDGCAIFGNESLTAKLECFGRRDGGGSNNIVLNQLPEHTRGRLTKTQWILPPTKELNRDLTNGNGDLPLSTFEKRTKEDIIGSASRITAVKYSSAETMLKHPIGLTQKPSTSGFVILLDDIFIKYLTNVIINFQDVYTQKRNKLSTIYKKILKGAGSSELPAWVNFWQVMVVMQENIERRVYVSNFVPVRTDEENDQRANDIERATRDALMGRQGQLPPTPDPEEELEKIKGRQKFFKQCALLLNALGLKENYNQELIKRCTRTDHSEGPINNGSVFDERLFMLEGDNHQDNSLSFLYGWTPYTAFFHDLPPRVFSYIKPKIKLFRIDDPEGSNYTETEFVFANKNDLNRNENFRSSTNFLTEEFDKGEGAGIKELSFQFNGTNPAESRNDIEATLTLYFQSFSDFVRERKSYNTNSYRFVDLIIQPKKEEKVRRKVHPNEYNPSFYKIRLDVGYNIPDNIDEIVKLDDFSANRQLFKELQGDNSVYEVVEALLAYTNKSFFLCMVDHDININNDGTVMVKINYRAYVETTLKTNEFDALTTKELKKRRKNNQETLRNVLNSGKCTIEEINELKTTINATEQVIREQSLKSIIQRLLDRKKIFIVRVNEKDSRHFREKGFFRGAEVPFENVISDSSRTPATQLVETDGTVNYILTNRMNDLNDFNYADETDRNVQFFYFGDLVHTICDILYKENGKDFEKGAERIRFILGSFQFSPYSKVNDSITRSLNIAEIPVSVDYFMNWFVDNIVSQGNARKTYPILVFLRNLLNNLLQQSLLEVCIDRNVEKTFRFQTSTISAFSENGHPLENKTNIKKDSNLSPKLSVKTLLEEKVLPFNGSPDIYYSYDNAVDMMHNYVLINAIDSDLSKKGKGSFEEDIAENGISHFNIGSNRGIVKNISFKKSDMQYVREARFFSHGIDGLLQLSSVYVANIEMFGNTLYYPGMTIYINPYGIGGTEIGSPSDITSVANKLGFGGYHTITNVKTSITPESFNTTVTAQWYYSGDGRSRFGSDGMTITNDDQNLQNNTRDPRDEQLCSQVISTAQVNLVELDRGQSVNSLSTLDFPESPIPQTSVPTETTTLTAAGGVKTSAFTYVNGNGEREQISIEHTDEHVTEKPDGRKSVTYFKNGVVTGIYRTRKETGGFTEQTVTVRSLIIPQQNNKQITVIEEPTTINEQADGE